MQTTMIALSMAFLLTGPQSGSVQEAPAGSYTVRDCLVELIKDVNVPAQVAGVLKGFTTPLLDADGKPVLDADGKPRYLEVREGALVREGQILAQIDDELEQKLKKVAEYKLQVAKMEAKNYVSVQYAQAAHEVARAEVAQAYDANRRYPGTVPPSELNRMLLAQRQASLQIEQSEYDLRVAGVSVSVRQAEDEVAALQIGQRKIVAPLDGIVMKRYFNAGEWVQPGDPVLRIIRIDRVRIGGFVDATQLRPHQVRVGQKVTLHENPNHPLPLKQDALRQPIQGRVVFVSPEIVGGKRFEVWAEVDNVRVALNPSRPQDVHWLLLKGLTVDMEIHLDEAPDAQPVVQVTGSE